MAPKPTTGPHHEDHTLEGQLSHLQQRYNAMVDAANQQTVIFRQAAKIAKLELLNATHQLQIAKLQVELAHQSRLIAQSLLRQSRMKIKTLRRTVARLLVQIDDAGEL